MMTIPTLRSELLDAYSHAGTALATVYVPTRSDVEDAPHRLDIHRDNLLRELGDAGANDALVAVVESNLDALEHSDGIAHLLVANDRGVVLSKPMMRPLTEAKLWFQPVPMLVPLIGATQVDQPHIAALIDRSGADVMLRSGVSDPLDSFEVDGPYKRLHRSAPGGWSQKRFQQTAENAWELNAREVIDQILGEHDDVELIICGGDERAVGFFVQHLPKHIEVAVIDGSRQADADAFLDSADVVLRDRAAARQVALLDRFRTALGADNAVKGRAVIDMLVQGRVSDLLVVDNSTTVADVPTIAFDFSANIKGGDAPSSGADSDVSADAPLVETAVAQAVATGANVHVVAATSDTEDGLAAILRF